MSSRKSRLRRNAGGTVAQTDPRFHEQFFDGPQLAELRTSIVLPERLFRAVLTSEIERLRANEAELTRFFSHFFDPTSSAEERATYVADFIRNPPVVVMGYPKSIGTWPIFAIVLSNEAQNEEVLSQFVGETLQEENPRDREDQHYEGAFFDQTYAVYVIGTHPDQTLYLYHFVKLVLFAARGALTNAGVIDPHYSGGELSPDEMLLPDNAYGRVLTISCKTMQTVPQVLNYRDGRNLRVAGLFREDVVVDGLRGGVETYASGDDDDGQEQG